MPTSPIDIPKDLADTVNYMKSDAIDDKQPVAGPTNAPHNVRKSPNDISNDLVDTVDYVKSYAIGDSQPIAGPSGFRRTDKSLPKAKEIAPKRVTVRETKFKNVRFDESQPIAGPSGILRKTAKKSTSHRNDIVRLPTHGISVVNALPAPFLFNFLRPPKIRKYKNKTVQKHIPPQRPNARIRNEFIGKQIRKFCSVLFR